MRQTRLCCVLFLAAACLSLGGCAVAGIAARAAVTTKVKPSYTGFAGQSVSIIVDADRGTRIDYPSLQLDVSQGIWRKLQNARDDKKNPAPELAGTQFPPERGPDAIVRFQQNNPGLVQSMTDLAPRLGVTRLIYIDVENFSTHPESIPELFRGSLSAHVRVIEVADRRGTVAFDERVSVTFPKNSPEEGVPDLGEARTYVATVDAFTTEVLKKFVTHEAEE